MQKKNEKEKQKLRRGDKKKKKNKEKGNEQKIARAPPSPWRRKLSLVLPREGRGRAI